MSSEINFVIGGEAGQGVQSVGFLLAKIFSRGGYHVFADQDYESRIRGGHNFFRVRVKDTPVMAIAEQIDVLVALNRETVDLHRKELASNAVVLYDAEKAKDLGSDGTLFPIPLSQIAEEKTGNKITANTVALGAALGLVGYDLDRAGKALQDQFGADAGDMNIRAARAGYDYARTRFKGEFDRRLKPVNNATRMLVNGNEALCLGAIAAGCKFVAGYPMTPSTSILEYIGARARDLDLAFIQPEDEISTINMVIGAAFAGARAMTATSGSGFCLMVEGLGLAGITETPVVIINGQRPGPAVGLPTRTEQGDLEFMIYAHHGEFPRAVLAPRSIEDAFWVTVHAFNLADRFQTPVIILNDHYLASSYATVERFDLSKVVIDRGVLYSESATGGPPQAYKRHKITASGVSPRAFPGTPEMLVCTDSDEHDEEGHLTEDATIRTSQMDKRMRKLSGMKKDVIAPVLYGPEKADTTLIGWGSTFGPLREVVDTLVKEKASVNLLHLSQVWPFPSEAVAERLDKAKTSYVVENNATGQLSHLIRAETGRAAYKKILKYDGRPFTPALILEQIRQEVH